MNCTNARRLWQEKIDGNRLPGEAALHFESCNACRVYATQMAAMVDALDDLRRRSEGIGSQESALDAFEPAGVRPLAHSRMSIRVLTRIAASLALAGGVYVLVRGFTHRSRVGPPQVASERVTLGRGDSEILVADDHSSVLLRGKSAGRFLLVEQSTHRSDVELVWLYPVLDPKPPVSRDQPEKPLPNRSPSL